MFTLPQNHTTSTAGIPIVVIPESTEDLRTLLLFCHPGTTPDPPSSLERFYYLHRIADKYMLESILTWLRKGCLPGFLETIPVGVYVLARQLGWKAEARLAAKRCLSLSVSELAAWSSPLLREVSASFLQELFKYHQECAKFLSDAMSIHPWAHEWCYSPDHVNTIHFRAGEEDCCKEPHEVGPELRCIYTRTWWNVFISECSEALARAPSFERIPVAEIFCKVAKVAGKCADCGPLALERLAEFSKVNQGPVLIRLDQAVRVSVIYLYPAVVLTLS